MSRRTKEQVEQLNRQIINVLEADHPQSVRHMFYRMTDPRLPEPVNKRDKGKNNGYRAVQRRLKKLRRSERIPYSWITDESRRGYFTPTYSNASEFLRSVHGQYRADLWSYTNNYCEVWAESRSIAGVIEKLCRELAVSLYPSGGFSSISFAYQAATQINNYYAGKNVHILYIGDHDPSGVLIDQSLEEELRLHLHPEIDVAFNRIAVTEDQITKYDLPTKPRKKSERRVSKITETVEAEAMPAGLLRKILRNEIEKLLPSRALETAMVAEQSEKEHLRKMANLLENGDYE